MSDYVPQTTDKVRFTLTFPSTTEEWAEDVLLESGANFDAVFRDADNKLIVEQTIGGNCNAVTCARGFLDEVEDALRVGDVDPMQFEFIAEALPA